MAAIEWDATSQRKYELGVDRGVLYIYDAKKGTYGTGVAWNGLTSVTESPDGAESSDMWADNMKYGSFRSAETFGGTIEAYTYPDEFEQCDGSAEIADGVTIGQQARATFGFTYRTRIGNDITDELGYKIHIVYGATASPSEKQYETINDSPEAITFSWEFETTPVSVTGYKPTSLITIDSTQVSEANLKKIEDTLYGGSGSAASPTLPLPDAIKALMSTSANTGA